MSAAVPARGAPCPRLARYGFSNCPTGKNQFRVSLQDGVAIIMWQGAEPGELLGQLESNAEIELPHAVLEEIARAQDRDLE